MVSSSLAKGALATLLLSNCHANTSPRRRGQESSAKKTRKYPIYKADKHDKLDKLDKLPGEDVLDTILIDSKSLRISDEELYELSTTYEGGWVQDGIMFDVSLSNSTQGISVLGLDVLTPVAFQSLCVEIYSREGTYEGFDTDASAWDFLGSVSILGLGKDRPTNVPLGSFDPVYIAPDSTRAFYVTTQDESLRYTAYPGGEHVSGSVFSSSSEGGVNVDVVVGVAKNYPFAQSWPNRMFNGAIRYAVGNNVDLDTVLSFDQAATAEIARRGKFTCDEEPVVTTESPLTASPISSVATGAPVASPAGTDAPVGAANSPSTAPVTSLPTKAPTSAIITADPSAAPSDGATESPTTLAFTMKKLATTLHGGLKQAGVMFDIRVPSVEEGGPPEGVTILTFEVSTFLTEEICVEVYSKEGTHVGYETDVVQGDDGSWSSPTWSALGAATATGKGEANPTHLPVGAFDHTHIKPGDTQAFYVTMNVPEMRYTEPRYNEQTGDVFVESSMGHLQIMVGTAKTYPFADSWADRIYNGAVIFALGEVEDGTYSEISASERSRSCSGPSITSPTKSPSTSTANTDSPVVQTATQTTAAASDDKATTAATDKAVTAATDSPDEEGDDDVTLTASTAASFSSSDSRLDDTCPSASQADASTSKEVVVEYTYNMITSSGKSVTELEDVMHAELVDSKCSGGSEARKIRQLQESIDYFGFNSNPPDEVVAGEECSGVTLAPGEECQVVKGGFTAYVPSSVEDSAVRGDLEPFANNVLADNGAVVASDADSPRGEVDSAVIEDQAPEDSTEETPTLSTVAIIVLAAVAGCVFLALMLIFIK